MTFREEESTCFDKVYVTKHLKTIGLLLHSDCSPHGFLSNSATYRRNHFSAGLSDEDLLQRRLSRVWNVLGHVCK